MDFKYGCHITVFILRLKFEYLESLSVWSSMNGVLNIVVDILLAIGVACGVWAVGYVVALLTRKIVTLSLGKIGFDDWVRKLNIGRAVKRTGYMPSEFFGLMAHWIVIVIFIALGFLAMSMVMGSQNMVYFFKNIITVYIAGFLKALLIIIIGFILVDIFVGYVYKSTELRAEMQVLYPLGEYLRIVLYIAVVTYALEQGGIGLGVLASLLIPVIWGITIAIILIVVYLILQSIKTSGRAIPT